MQGVRSQGLTLSQKEEEEKEEEEEEEEGRGEWFMKYVEMDYARAGNKAAFTASLDPGPLEQSPHSLEPQLRQLGLPTALKRGALTLLSDYEVCKEGDVLMPKQARVLKLSGYEMAEFKVTMKYVWDAQLGRFQQNGALAKACWGLESLISCGAKSGYGDGIPGASDYMCRSCAGEMALVMVVVGLELRAGGGAEAAAVTGALLRHTGDLNPQQQSQQPMGTSEVPFWCACAQAERRSFCWLVTSPAKECAVATSQEAEETVGFGSRRWAWGQGIVSSQPLLEDRLSPGASRSGRGIGKASGPSSLLLDSWLSLLVLGAC
ncbi:mRNA turnover protein 4 like protein [Tupaia chinensis]|uniref:mRNA turnover protein 4 like protein n=1 Tax=Tupaia chinensis TaxID=246437 RepID=L9KX89_TUPCH|nr:mRNA turnover protein 4 like protein [Tupaia chinensis]